MQQFVVPQFIDNEDKIIGPVTVRQFIIVLVDVLVLAALYKMLDFSGFMLAVLFLGGFGIVLAFVKVNGRGFHYFILNIIQIAIRPAIRVWKQELKAHTKNTEKDAEKIDTTPTPKVVKAKDVEKSHLSELSLLVDTGGKYKPETKL